MCGACDGQEVIARDVGHAPPEAVAVSRMLDRMEAAFFDLDKTVIAKASMAAFGRPLYRAGMISRWLVLRALWGQFLFQLFGADEERMRKVRESALRVTRGWEQAKVNAIVRDTLTDVIEPIVFDEALELIREHQDAGRRVFIISASPEEIVAPLARYLGVDEAIATRAMLDDEGRYTGEVDFYAYGPYKAQAITEVAELEGIDLERSFAYSDSATDLPMLEVVGHPVAVNPDRELARAASDRGWEVRRFEQRVALRDRVTLPPPGKVAAISGGVVVLGAAGATTWWVVRKLTAPPAPPPSRRQRAARLVRKRLGAS
jgi:HAD superfamily hydrolase (TIGR01490 family)